MTLANSGPCEELELALAGRAVLLDDLGAGDVGRHQVGRELDAAEGQRQRTCDSVEIIKRLGQAGHAFEDAVAPAEQRDQQFLDDLVLADDDAAQLFLDIVEGVAQAADGFEIILAHFGRHVAGALIHGQGGSERLFVHAGLFDKRS